MIKYCHIGNLGTNLTTTNFHLKRPLPQPIYHRSRQRPFNLVSDFLLPNYFLSPRREIRLLYLSMSLPFR